MLMTGLRGVGKTVLLNEIERIAEECGCATIVVEAHENKTLGALITPALRRLLFDLDRVAGAGDKVKRGFAVLRSFIGSLNLTIDEVSIGLDVSPAQGSADSGDIEADLPVLFNAIGEAALERKRSVALFIDEVQYFNARELGALIMAMHKVQQRQLPIALVGAGLPILPGLAGDSKSYAERLFTFPDIGALNEKESAEAIRDPALKEGVRIAPSALTEIFRVTKGYPYFLQEWGYQAWNLAKRSPITKTTVMDATPLAIARLDKNFFRVRYERLTPGEKKFLRAMAELGPGPYRTGEIAQTLDVKTTSMQQTRAGLIKKGMIYSPAYGDMAFTVPLFDEFMRRVVPVYEH